MNVIEMTQLVSRAQNGERSAFDQLVYRFEAKIYRAVVSRLGNDSDAREVTQDAFLQAYAKLAQLRDPRYFGTWLFRIAHRKTVDRALRRRTDVIFASSTLDKHVNSDTSPLEVMLIKAP